MICQDLAACRQHQVKLQVCGTFTSLPVSTASKHCLTCTAVAPQPEDPAGGTLLPQLIWLCQVVYVDSCLSMTCQGNLGISD